MLYKVLDLNGRSYGGDNMQWSLPTHNDDGTWTPGAWALPIEGKLAPWANGYHGARDTQVLKLLGPRLFEMEYRGEVNQRDDVIVCRETRLLREFTAWNDRTARLFTVWCARQTLALVDNPNPLYLEACNVAERYANGDATDTELYSAWHAAWNAAEYDLQPAARHAVQYAVRYATWLVELSFVRYAAAYITRYARHPIALEERYAYLRELIYTEGEGK